MDSINLNNNNNSSSNDEKKTQIENSASKWNYSSFLNEDNEKTNTSEQRNEIRYRNEIKRKTHGILMMQSKQMVEYHKSIKTNTSERKHDEMCALFDLANRSKPKPKMVGYW